MRKLWIATIAFTIVCVLAFSSCANVNTRGYDNNEQIADKTIVYLIDAIKLKDESGIRDLFAAEVRADDGLEGKISQLIQFIEGEIISYSSSKEVGVGENYEMQNGKEKKDILSAFSITTTQKEYYVAIKECTVNEADQNGAGVLSIYIIEASKWTKDYVYRGDGMWSPGINIE